MQAHRAREQQMQQIQHAGLQQDKMPGNNCIRAHCNSNAIDLIQWIIIFLSELAQAINNRANYRCRPIVMKE